MFKGERFFKEVLHLDPRSFFEGVLVQNSARLLQKRMKTFSSPDIFTSHNLYDHYGDQPLANEGQYNVTKNFIAARIDYLREKLPPDLLQNGRFTDLGDSSGIFLHALGKTGVSVNLSRPALENIRAKGIEAVSGDVSALPFPDAAFDVVLCFETLEHVPNPIAVLREIRRVCGKAAILSIPWVHQTNIHSFPFGSSHPVLEHHIFELCHADFLKLLTHAGFVCQDHQIVQVLDNGKTLRERAAMGLWRLLRQRDFYCGVLKKFSLYYLTPTTLPSYAD